MCKIALPDPRINHLNRTFADEQKGSQFASRVADDGRPAPPPARIPSKHRFEPLSGGHEEIEAAPLNLRRCGFFFSQPPFALEFEPETRTARFPNRIIANKNPLPLGNFNQLRKRSEFTEVPPVAMASHMPEKITAQVGDKQSSLKPENSPNRRTAP